MNAESGRVATWIAFALVYVGLAVGKLPFLRLDRSGIALVGATAMLVLGLVSFPEAVASVDFRTIALLFGMMVVVAYLRLAGFFRRLSGWLLARARSPHGVLAAVVGLAGALSAFLVNDVVCLALGPVVLALARRSRRDPVPYLVALATAANIGSVATITGNPQNMIIGALSRVRYATFAAHLAPVAVVGLVIDYGILALVFRRALAEDVEAGPPSTVPRDPAGEPSSELLPKGVIVLAGLVALFFAGAPVELVALGAASLLMLGRVRPERLYAQIDWNLLVMFSGLFVVVHGFEHHVVSGWERQPIVAVQGAPVVALTAVAAILSNVVSNVPAVLLLKSAVASLGVSAQAHAWLTLAMASTLSGEPHPDRLRREPHHRGRRAAGGRSGLVLVVLQGRRAGDRCHVGGGRRMAIVDRGVTSLGGGRRTAARRVVPYESLRAAPLPRPSSRPLPASPSSARSRSRRIRYPPRQRSHSRSSGERTERRRAWSIREKPFAGAKSRAYGRERRAGGAEEEHPCDEEPRPSREEARVRAGDARLCDEEARPRRKEAPLSRGEACLGGEEARPCDEEVRLSRQPRCVFARRGVSLRRRCTSLRRGDASSSRGGVSFAGRGVSPRRRCAS